MCLLRDKYNSAFVFQVIRKNVILNIPERSYKHTFKTEEIVEVTKIFFSFYNNQLSLYLHIYIESYDKIYSEHKYICSFSTFCFLL